ncbi:MAG: Vps62-related protein [Candidatus Thermoplasmatota archaeon]|nr:Vps62-related protein [Candidatus Thermoplasmatota archaeon]
MNKKRVLSVFFISLMVSGLFLVHAGSAADEDIAEQYAPILYFVHDETCYPVDISYALENSYVFEVGNPTPVFTSPTAELLSNLTSEFYYLDNQRGTVAVDDSGIENDYQNQMTTLGYTVYAHVDTQSNVIQYWFFYAFNAGDLNRHEGDWEMIQIVLSNGQPSEVMFSQHYSGQKATWSQVEKEGDHVKVYVARGSHANYIKSFSGKVGLASDTVADNGKIIRPSEYTMELLEDQPWLSFAGRWGWVGADESTAAEAMILGEAGPNGPKYREDGTMWQPLVWAAGLQPANDMLFLLEWLVYNFVLLFLLFVSLSLVLLVFFIYRRRKKYGLGPRIFSLFYIDGSNQKSIGNLLCIVAIILAVLALFYPWYTVTANVTVPPDIQTGTFDALSVDGIQGIQIRLPNRSGPVPLGTFALPFYLIIIIGLVFLVLSTIGISQSKKLGKKYILRGIRLLLPFLLILLFILIVASLLPLFAPGDLQGNSDMLVAMQRVSASPFSGEYTIQTADVDGGTIQLQWGFGIGAYLLLFAGIVLIMAGLLEVTAHEPLFEEKTPLTKTLPAETEKKETQKKD